MNNKTSLGCKRLCLIFAATLMLTTGCQTYKGNKDWEAGRVQPAALTFKSQADRAKDGKDGIVLRLEAATALQAVGQPNESLAMFDLAEQKIDSYDNQAKVKATDETAALLTTQANLPYRGRDYDKIMLNAYKALNYLQLGVPEKARVELIRASQRQQDSEENNKKRIANLESDIEKLKESKEKGAAEGKEMADKAQSDPKFKSQLQTNYLYLDGFESKANYVNPFVYYLDALYFLTANNSRTDLERARDSFRFTLNTIGDNKYIKQDIDMVDQALNGASIPPTTYVLFETGRAPTRDQIRLDIPLFLVGQKEVPYVGAAFPTLKFQDGHLPGLNVSAAGAKETTIRLANMDEIIGRAFKDELPSIVTKTLISTAIKAAAMYGVDQAMKKNNQSAGDVWAQLIVKVVMSAIAASVNIADTRTWTTLPKEVQFCRIPTPSDGKIELSGPNGMPKAEVTVTNGAINLIHVRCINATNDLIVTQFKLK